jgi:hypothetical protein
MYLRRWPVAEEQPHIELGAAQVVDHLAAVRWGEEYGRLQLDDDSAFDKKIDAMPTDSIPLVVDLHGHLSSKVQSTLLQLTRQGRLVHRFQEAEIEDIVRLVERTDDEAGQFLLEKVVCMIISFLCHAAVSLKPQFGASPKNRRTDQNSSTACIVPNKEKREEEKAEED